MVDANSLFFRLYPIDARKVDMSLPQIEEQVSDTVMAGAMAGVQSVISQASTANAGGGPNATTVDANEELKRKLLEALTPVSEEVKPEPDPLMNMVGGVRAHIGSLPLPGQTSRSKVRVVNGEVVMEEYEEEVAVAGSFFAGAAAKHDDGLPLLSVKELKRRIVEAGGEVPACVAEKAELVHVLRSALAEKETVHAQSQSKKPRME
eukprot:TRINITY_DN15363_c0_g3_i1.p1 TRINITY_DN15363_c0_g3~~TRINITY_DN15363_c0_g3_i1.p1  ORF type:complete len:206 (-),score=49.59 TRINITY_DN15363_c0_g3_i1:201-818(-)